MYCCFRAYTTFMLKKPQTFLGKALDQSSRGFSLSWTQPSCWLALLINFLHLFPQSKQFTSLPPTLKKQKQLGQGLKCHRGKETSSEKN